MYKLREWWSDEYGFLFFKSIQICQSAWPKVFSRWFALMKRWVRIIWDCLVMCINDIFCKPLHIQAMTSSSNYNTNWSHTRANHAMV